MSRHVVVIAEAGVNHNADPDLALKMIKAAKDAGADYVKFQTAVPELVISSVAPKATYQEETTGAGESQLDMCRKLHFPIEYYRELKKECEKAGIGFSSTPFDLVSLEFLIELGIDFIKVPSGEITNRLFLEAVAESGLPVVLSTGMSTFEEVERAVNLLSAPREGETHEERLSRITLLQCNTQYPTPFADVNLLAMPEMGRRLGVRYGYSDHTPGIEASVAAVALGASVVEKHFTLSNRLPGPDQKASLEPAQLAEMVKAIRNVELALGSPQKEVSPSERENIIVARKSVVAARDIAKGETFTLENITVKRPGNGISAWDIQDVIGREAKRDFPYDSLIEL
ncbi:MAG: N-acetylneuraminate synthase [Muribaculaceae bacterium]|nr:N-acetylneuraminate synthase [Muribaculaceae bacterium]